MLRQHCSSVDPGKSEEILFNLQVFLGKLKNYHSLCSVYAMDMCVCSKCQKEESPETLESHSWHGWRCKKNTISSTSRERKKKVEENFIVPIGASIEWNLTIDRSARRKVVFDVLRIGEETVKLLDDERIYRVIFDSFMRKMSETTMFVPRLFSIRINSHNHNKTKKFITIEWFPVFSMVHATYNNRFTFRCLLFCVSRAESIEKICWINRKLNKIHWDFFDFIFSFNRRRSRLLSD